MERKKLFGKTLSGLAEVASEMGLPRFGAGQLASWLYHKNVRQTGSMTDISVAARTRLAEHFDVGLSTPLAESVSADGTRKYLFSPGVESVFIPDGDRATLCLSSQAGCRMGCAFCATGRGGLTQDLSAGEILNQFASLPQRDCLTNIVYMGMGEPLDNLDAVLSSLEILTSSWGYAWSPTRITVSTAGVAPALERFLAESRVHLAVSLHNPFPDERAMIMPIERAYPIEHIVQIIRGHFMRDHSHHGGSSQRRVSFEYIVLEGLNDSPRHVIGLAKLLNGLSCRINLIRFHRIPDSPFFSPSLARVEQFRDALNAKGLRATIRASRGEDIEAACGLLSTNSLSLHL